MAWIAGATAAGLLLGAAAATYVQRDRPGEETPSFRRLTFRRGHVSAARFAPDGQSVISTASWDGAPSQIAATRLDTGESTALPLAGALLRAISRAGDLAVIVKGDVLARVPIGGAGIRDVLDHVFDADWTPDGTLGVVRHQNDRAWVECPPGRRLYAPDNTIHAIRLSPDGALIAVGEQERLGGGGEWLTIIDRQGAIVGRSRKRGANAWSAIAWTPTATRCGSPGRRSPDTRRCTP